MIIIYGYSVKMNKVLGSLLEDGAQSRNWGRKIDL